jgi:arsenate reductase
MKKRVLFLCTHNSARSQMAEGLLRKIGGEHFEVFSAGTEKTRVHPLAIEAMGESGIDISNQRSKTLDEFDGQQFDYVITVYARANESARSSPGSRSGFTGASMIRAPRLGRTKSDFALSGRYAMRSSSGFASL